MTRSLVALAMLLCTAAASAQPGRLICITGQVEPSPGFTICMQGETHLLADTRVWLKSSTVHLPQYEGQVVRVVGRDIGVTCTVLDVMQVTPASATLSWCGSGSTCCDLKLSLCPGGLGRGVIMAATGPGYQPMGCAQTGFLDGTFLLGADAFPIWVGTFGACGGFQFSVPCDNALVGVDVWFQGARHDIGPVGPLFLSNVLRVRIAPFLPPCAPINC
jgi:hypothetical protein